MAGLAGVTATGAVIARNERHRRAYSPDDVRERLHARLDSSGSGSAGASAATGGTEDSGGPPEAAVDAEQPG
jgi:hypothetical protein